VFEEEKGVPMTKRLFARFCVWLLFACLAAALLHYSFGTCLASEGEEGGGSSLKLVMVVAFIWLAIMALVITVVVVTRRRAGEEERESREG
jgi:uncharacterized membrane protein